MTKLKMIRWNILSSLAVSFPKCFLTDDWADIVCISFLHYDQQLSEWTDWFLPRYDRSQMELFLTTIKVQKILRIIFLLVPIISANKDHQRLSEIVETTSLDNIILLNDWKNVIIPICAHLQIDFFLKNQIFLCITLYVDFIKKIFWKISELKLKKIS